MSLKSFGEFIKLLENEVLNEAVKSTVLSKLMSTKDRETLDYFKSIAKKDNVKLSDIEDKHVQKTWVNNLSQLKKDLKWDITRRSHVKPNFRGGIIKRKLFSVHPDNNLIIAGWVYDTKTQEIDLEFAHSGYDITTKNVSQSLKSVVNLNISLEWYIVDLPTALNIDYIKDKKIQKELELVHKREFADEKVKLEKKEEELIESIKGLWKEVGNISADISSSQISYSSGTISLDGKFAHDIQYYLRGSGFGEDGSKSYFELSVGSAGSFNPIKEALKVERYKAVGNLADAILSGDKRIDDLINLHKEMYELQNSAGDFKFQHNGITWMRDGMRGFRPVEPVNEAIIE